MTMSEQVALYKEDLGLFADDNERLEYLLDYGKQATTLDPTLKTEENRIKGCSSLAWLQKDFKDGKVRLQAEGDSIIAKGMLVVLLSIFDDRTPDEILAFDQDELKQMGVMELLSPVRQQGLEAFLNVIYDFTKRCKEQL